MRRRIWTEHLSAEVLADDPTISLLDRFSLEPIVALPPHRENEQMFEALGRLKDASIPVGIWPLLSDDEGYWPCLENARAYQARVLALVDTLGARGIQVRTVAVDLEPPLSVTRALYARGGSLTFFRRAGGALSRSSRKAWHEAERGFLELRAALKDREIESIAAFYPPLAFDLSFKTSLFGRALGTPGAAAGWDALSPMLYSSVIESLLPFSKERLARRVFEATARSLVRTVGQRAAISVGLVDTGKLGNEATLDDPSALARDVALARQWGIDDLALFSLEGILSKERPEQWLEAFGGVRTST